MKIRLTSGAATDVGQVRAVNEDSFVVDTSVAAVADGMGGHRGGAVASRIAVETLWASFRLGSLASLVTGITSANDEILSQAAADPELHNMGTTLCAIGVVVAEGRELVGIVNVGDSRVYQLRTGQMEQITEDHSLVESMVREGRLTPAEAETHPQRNIVTRAVGVNPVVQVDEFVLEPVAGDRYLLCSDGLSNEVDDAAIVEILTSHADVNEAAHTLVATANKNGGRDNITCIVVDLSLVDGEPAVAPAVEPVAATASQSSVESAAAGQAPTAPTPVVQASAAPEPAAKSTTASTPAPPPPSRRWWKRG